MSKKIQFQFKMDMPPGMSLVESSLPVYPQRTPVTEKLKIKVKTERDHLKIAVIGLVIFTIACVATVVYQYHVNKIERIQTSAQLQVSSLKPIIHTPVTKTTPIQRDEPIEIAKEVPLVFELTEQPTKLVAKPPITDQKSLAKKVEKSTVAIPELVIANKKSEAPSVSTFAKETLPHFIIADSKTGTTPQKNGIFKRPVDVESKSTETKQSSESPTPQKLF